MSRRPSRTRRQRRRSRKASSTRRLLLAAAAGIIAILVMKNGKDLYYGIFPEERFIGRWQVDPDGEMPITLEFQRGGVVTVRPFGFARYEYALTSNRIQIETLESEGGTEETIVLARALYRFPGHDRVIFKLDGVGIFGKLEEIVLHRLPAEE